MHFDRYHSIARMVLVLAFTLGLPSLGISQSGAGRLNVDLILTPDFCKTPMNWGREKFNVGDRLCAALEKPLAGVFGSVHTLDHDPGPNASTADIILVPKIDDVSSTVHRNMEFVMVLEWTATDPTGKTIWLNTVQASARRNWGSAFTGKKNINHMIDDGVADAVQKTVAAINGAPELSGLKK